MSYNLNSLPDFYRYLTEHFTAKPEPRVDENASVLNPKFDEKGVFIGSDDNFSPEESIERMWNGYGRSWPNGVDQPPVIDPVSSLGHALHSFQHGWDPFTGVSFQGAIETQEAEGIYTITGEVKVIQQSLDAKLVTDALKAISVQIDNIKTGK